MIIAKTENGKLKGVYFRDEYGKDHILKTSMDSEMKSNRNWTFVDCLIHVDEIE